MKSIQFLIEEAKKGLAGKYKFPYSAYVLLFFRREGCIRIPASLFEKNKNRGDFAISLPLRISSESDYSEEGMSQEEWDEYAFSSEYKNICALMKATREEFLGRLDSLKNSESREVPWIFSRLGIVSAELVVPDSEKLSYSFYKSGSYEGLQALEEISKRLQLLELGFPDSEEEIKVEGTAEIRRQVNEVWQHKHEGYDYWHPMSRIHAL